AVIAYQQEKTRNPNEGALQEGHLNHVGYHLLQEGQSAQAVRVFTLATRLYPQSGNAFDSLAEACLRNGDKTQARANYARALALDPHNSNAANRLRELAEK
ncbi:MAG: tetratricopeptide repeat protein, partial [Hymenobacter sp.]